MIVILVWFNNLQASGVMVTDECMTAYEDMKLKHKFKYLVFKISDDSKSIEVEKYGEPSDEPDKEQWKALAKELQDKGEARYVMFDFKIEKTDGTGNDKLGFVYW